jgi:hypothetical protein
VFYLLPQLRGKLRWWCRGLRAANHRRSSQQQERHKTVDVTESDDNVLEEIEGHP